MSACGHDQSLTVDHRSPNSKQFALLYNDITGSGSFSKQKPATGQNTNNLLYSDINMVTKILPWLQSHHTCMDIMSACTD